MGLAFTDGFLVRKLGIAVESVHTGMGPLCTDVEAQPQDRTTSSSACPIQQGWCGDMPRMLTCCYGHWDSI